MRRICAWIAALSLCGLLLAPATAADLRSRTETAAAAAARQARATEPAEGAQDLVDDEVDVKLRHGSPVIEQTGEASYYGRHFDGQRTASGERYDPRQTTAAHPTLPLGTEATVTNLDTGKRVEVEINDRGPHVRGRDLDLSRRAAEKIGLGKNGVAPVEIEARLPRGK
ncbi:MAG TPA: septal ring lytic transglycosylase RlpA family protein [Gammaproteobacteria bacterium]|nr:septal ring lytic transglycosylase RlpA family protein [Gammaproteobacteria bacterium]